MDDVRDPKNGGKRVQEHGSHGAASPPAGEEGGGEEGEARGDRRKENGACGGECCSIFTSGGLRAFQEDISNPHKADSLTLSSSFFQLGPVTTYEEVWTPTKPLKELLISGA